jgi:adenosylmethionine-8-amino-7-oxononanoate aminotransferase
LVREELFESFTSEDRRRTLFHGHSFTANPIACAAALASLSMLDEACAAERRRIEQAQLRGVDRLKPLPGVANARVLGTVLALEVETPADGYLSAIGPSLNRYALDRGVLLRPLGNTIYVLPPYCSTDDDLAQAHDVIAEFVSTR